MDFISHPNFILALLIVCCFCMCFCSISNDTITSAQFIRDPETLISNNSVFKLGFFSPPNSSNRYLGIWYLSESNVIWVANRNQPLTENSSGIVKISTDGNLVILDTNKRVVWSSNVTRVKTNSSANLLDTGNLVLLDGATGETIWESFQHPSHAMVPKMKLSTNKITGEKTHITSWRSPSDPSVGYYTATLEHPDAPEVFLWVNGTRPYWRSGPWNGKIFIGIALMSAGYLRGSSVINEDDGNVYLIYNFPNQSDFGCTTLTPQGQLTGEWWNHEKLMGWESSPGTSCDLYGYCGPFGSCDWLSSPICSCLSGYEPKSLQEWNRKNWTSGCVRKDPLQCGGLKNGSELSKDGFSKLENIKVPDFVTRLNFTENECKVRCLNNCSCVAYAYDSGIGCMVWSGDLIDVQKLSSGGVDLYIRVPPSQLDKRRHKSHRRFIIPVGVTIGMITLAGCAYLSWKWTAKPAARKRKRFNSGKAPAPTNKSDIGDLSNVELQELLLFDAEKIAIATNNFHSSNKLGQGGFGPVYKGKLHDGQEIAVKRLSRSSGQGLDEFVNEVALISNLQHRNLVKLLGYCREGDEKMLIYEYMPNKSLDTFVFDWKRRFNIIEGIARGLLYLHRDSRLIIIHRDLKASNVLLDEELNPKISNFGLTRIFGGPGDEANTRRVVGTYGYMAPEYAMEGLFSEKSDIFSFGVLLLEIVSGRRNYSFYNDEQSLSLLGFAWKLWQEDNIVSLIDPSICDPVCEKEILRCIHIGLLCTQESARERPTMPTVTSMLNSEIVNLLPPGKPAFILRQNMINSSSSNDCHALHSNNGVSITSIQGR